MKFGTAQEDNEILKFSCKLVPISAGFDENSNDKSDNERGLSARKKWKIIEDFCEISHRQRGYLKELTSVIVTPLSGSASIYAIDSN